VDEGTNPGGCMWPDGHCLCDTALFLSGEVDDGMP